MRLKRRIAAFLTLVMAFSSVAVFSVSADAPLQATPFDTAPFEDAAEIVSFINGLTMTATEVSGAAGEVAAQPGLTAAQLHAVLNSFALMSGDLPAITNPVEGETLSAAQLAALNAIIADASDALRGLMYNGAVTLAGAENLLAANPVLNPTPAGQAWTIAAPTVTHATAAASQVAALQALAALRVVVTPAIITPAYPVDLAADEAAALAAGTRPITAADITPAQLTLLTSYIAVQGGTPTGTRLPINFPQVSPFLAGPIGNLETFHTLRDRYVAGTNIGSTQAPELVLPMTAVPTQGGHLIVTMTGWGNNPWARFNAAFDTDSMVHNQIVGNPANADIRPTDLANVGWERLSANSFVYTGIQPSADGAFLGELSFHLQIFGQQLQITPLNRNWEATNSVLRVPLMANHDGGATNFTRNAPEVVLTGAVGHPSVNLPYVQTGGGVTALIPSVQTGRDFVDIATLSLRENAAMALNANGQIAISLPFGYRFDHNGSVAGATTVGGLGAGATVVFPEFVYSPSTGNEIRTMPRDGVVAQSVMLINLPATLNRPFANVAGTVTIENVRILSTAGRWDAANVGDVYFDITTGNNALGFVAGTNAGLRNAWHTLTNPSIRVALFADFGVTVQRAAGAAGQIPTIVAGWLPAEGQQAGRAHQTTHERGRGRDILTGVNAFGNTATITVSETVPASLWGTHGFRFTLVDAEGNVHPYASIRSVYLNSTTSGTTNVDTHPSSVHGNFVNTRESAIAHHTATSIATGADAVGLNANTGTRGNATVNFSEDGRTVSVDRLEIAANLRNQDRLTVTANFAITADVGFEGAVYVAVTHGGQALPQDFARMDLAPVHILDVRRGIEIETETTYLFVGFQETAVANVTIREVEPGDFRSGTRGIQVSLGEFQTGHLSGGQAPMHFVPITTLQAANHISVGGAVNAQSRVGATLEPFHTVATSLNVNIGAPTRGDVPSYIELSNLAVRVVRDVPFGTYELVLRGPSVLDNENFVTNPVGTPGGPNMNFRSGTLAAGQSAFLNPSEAGWRRYAHGPLMYVNYINVATTPGTEGGVAGGAAGAGRVDATIVVPHAPGRTFTVNGETVEFRNNMSSVNLTTSAVINGVEVPAGRLYVPLASIIEDAFGGSYTFFTGNGADIPHVLRTFANGVVVYFTVGEGTAIVNGVRVPINYGLAPFIGDGTNGTIQDRMYFPLQGFGSLFNLPLVSGTGYSTIN